MKHLLQSAANEIRALRRENEILNAKVEVMELFACTLHTSPARKNLGAMHPDVLYQLTEKIDELKE